MHKYSENLSKELKKVKSVGVLTGATAECRRHNSINDSNALVEFISTY